MKASVLIRTFNNGRTISKVLEAVRSQNFSDYEIVVVDSGSTDGTLHILKDHPHVFVDYSKKPFSYSGSLNAGCGAAQGEYVVCLSSHCVPLDRGWLGSLMGAMESDERLAGAWGPLLFQKGVPPGGGVETIGLEEFLRRPNRGLQNPNSIIRRRLWEEHPFSEELERCEDQEWAHHFLQKGYLTGVVGGAEALYEIPHDPYTFARKTMKDFLALYAMFGFRDRISPARLARDSARLAAAAAAGRRSPRVSALLVASLAGRFVADKRIMYGRLEQALEEEPGSKQEVLTRILKEQAGRRAGEARRRLRGKIEGRGGAELAGMRGKIRFFLVGEMRSGTSWLSRTLDTHPQVFCKGEGSFFGRNQETEEIPVYTAPTPSLYNALLGGGDVETWQAFTWNSWGDEGSEEDRRQLLRLAVDYHLWKGSAGSGKRIIGDKSPLHTDHVDEIHDLYPEAKVVHILRDGRDVAVSLMNHFWRLAKDNGGIFDLDPEELEKRDAYLADPEGFIESGESIFTEERLRQMAARWSRRVSKASRDGHKFFGGGFVQIHYEDLLERPEENLKHIFRLLGARSDDRTVRRCVEKNRFEKLARRTPGREDAGSFFRKGVAGDWQNVFTASDREVYEAIAGDTLREMGYTVDEYK